MIFLETFEFAPCEVGCITDDSRQHGDLQYSLMIEAGISSWYLVGTCERWAGNGPPSSVKFEHAHSIVQSLSWVPPFAVASKPMDP